MCLLASGLSLAATCSVGVGAVTRCFQVLCMVYFVHIRFSTYAHHSKIKMGFFWKLLPKPDKWPCKQVWQRVPGTGAGTWFSLEPWR